MTPNTATQPEKTDLPWLTLPETGWTKISFPPPSPAIVESFDRLTSDPDTFDHYTPSAQRWRRFGQYQVYFRHGEWRLKRLDHEPFVQSAKHNKLVGGKKRWFEPLESEWDVALSPYISRTLDHLKADRSRLYHLDVHQYHIFGKPGSAGSGAPEGAHRDGMECVGIFVIKRHNVKGGESTLIDPATGEPFLRTMLEEGEGLLINDKKMLHDVSPITEGSRCTIVINVNPWEDRRCGHDHIIQALRDPSKPRKEFDAAAREAELRITANERFAMAKRLLRQKDRHVLNVVDSVVQKVHRLNDNYAGLNFSEQNLTQARIDALVVGANRYFKIARTRWIGGKAPIGELSLIHDKLEKIEILKGGVAPDKSDGLEFDTRRLEKLDETPPLWKLKERAHRDPRVAAWFYRKYPPEVVCL